MNVMMKCGHTAHATTSTGAPCCVICHGDPNALVIDDNFSFNGRKAQCVYCKKTMDSSFDLAFFEVHLSKEYDEYYCGCRGWD